jgi:hypothetical protein
MSSTRSPYACLALLVVAGFGTRWGVPHSHALSENVDLGRGLGQ